MENIRTVRPFTFGGLVPANNQGPCYEVSPREFAPPQFPDGPVLIELDGGREIEGFLVTICGCQFREVIRYAVAAQTQLEASQLAHDWHLGVIYRELESRCGWVGSLMATMMSQPITRKEAGHAD